MDFYALPDMDDRAKLTDKPLLSPTTSSLLSQAGIALRSWHTLQDLHAKSHGSPCTSTGKVICFPDFVRTQNNIFCKGSPMPCAIVTDGDKKSPTWCVVFTDRTAVIMRREAICVDGREWTTMRLLPVVLRLANKVALKPTGEKIALTVVADGTNADIQTKLLHGCVVDQFKSLYHSEAPTLEQHALMRAFDGEITTWGKKVSDLPYILDPGAGPRVGTIGKEIPAPNPEMVGRIYHWPVAYAGRNYDDALAQQAARYFDLVYAYHYEKIKSIADDALITVTAGAPKPGRSCTRPEVSATVENGGDPREAEQLIRSIFQTSMRLPVAPKGIQWMSGTRQFYTTSAEKKTALFAETLYSARLSTVPSNHDRLKALSLFDPYT